jgi:hypothetical protein
MTKLHHIILECGLPVTIDYDSKKKCKCGKEIIHAAIKVELTGLAKWDLHRCEE